MKQVGLKTFDSKLPLKLLKNLNDEIKEMPLKYGWKSDKHDPHGHWTSKVISTNKKDTRDWRFKLDKDKFPACNDYVEWLTDNVTGKNNLLRFYLSGHTYGIDGYPHTDCKRDNQEQTFVLYMTPGWKPEWAGETVVFNKNGDEIEKSVLPRFGRILTFPSQRLHAARAVSRKCNTLRLTLVCKLGVANEPARRVA